MMTDEYDDGGPAFPGGCILSETNVDRGFPVNSGISVLDYFAGRALVGELACQDDERMGAYSAPYNDLAGTCYDIATEMLAERKRRQAAQWDTPCKPPS